MKTLPTTTAASLAQELRATMRKLRRKLREQASLSDLSAAQIAVLHHLENDGPTTVSALARAEGIRPQSMGAIVASLQDAGFVIGTADPNDGRQTLLSLTEAWHAWIVPRRAVRQDWLTRKIAATLSPQEQDQVAQAIALINRLAEE